MNTSNVKQIFFTLLIAVGLTACGSDVGGNEDKTNPSTALTSLNGGEEVIGTFNLTWTTNDPNPSTVDIFLSSDSGVTYPTVVEINVPDTGQFSWDSNTVEDCRNCRIRIIPHDVVGNEGAPVESTEDFIINNVPQVLGVAYYSDLDNNGFDAGDEIRVPFDKALEIRTSIASDIFFFPVLGDNIGPFSTVRKSENAKELIITMDDISTNTNYHLHIGGAFKPNRLGLTFPSGINLQDNISEGLIFSPDTGRTAAIAEVGIDILPAFSDSGQQIGGGIDDNLLLGDLDNDGDLDMVAGLRIYFNENSNKINNTSIFFISNQEIEITASRALGDVDGDGDLDIVTEDGVWINDGDISGNNIGTFTDSGQKIGSENTRSIALGDIDRDGDLDIVVGNLGANRLWINGGDNSGSNTGIFTDSGLVLGDSDTFKITLNDMNGNGNLDIVAEESGTIHIWLNGGGNNNELIFTNSGQALKGTNPAGSFALGDIDGDDDLDIVTGSKNANHIWLNGGDSSGGNTGIFTEASQKLDSKNTQSIALGDIDNDGDLDIVTGNDNANRVWINGGNSSGSNTGIFTDSGLSLGDSGTFSIALGDIDGDNDLDVVTIGLGFISVVSNNVWLNSLKYPLADFIIDSGQALGNANTQSIALGDIDGDGDLDMVAGNDDANRVWFNGGNNNGSNSGVFIESGQELGGISTQSIALNDIDGDGDLDMIAGNDGTNRVWINGGDNNTGIFTDSGQDLGNENTQSITLGDIDGDGDLDIVAGNAGINRVWINGGDSDGSNTGIFTDSGQDLGNENTQSITLGDIDGDGDLDIVAGNTGINRVWINGGDSDGSNTGIFTDSGQALGTDSTQSIALGDVDGDGDLDMITANFDTNHVWINGGNSSGSNTGVFTDSGQALKIVGTIRIRSIILIDIDGDGDLDLVTGSEDNNPVEDGNMNQNRIWLNGGDSNGSNTGIFTSFQLLGKRDTQSIALGDIDGDDDLDIVTSNNGANRVWLNDF